MPSYSWAATAGKKYSLLVGLMRPEFPCGAAVHYFAYNIDNGTAVTEHLRTTLRARGTPGPQWAARFGSPGLYVHFLFEHDADLAFSLLEATRIVDSAGATDFASFIASVGLDNTMLVSLNWMVLRDSILSRATLEADRCELKPAACVTSKCNFECDGIAVGTARTVPTSSVGGRKPRPCSICATCPSTPLALSSKPRLRPTAA